MSDETAEQAETERKKRDRSAQPRRNAASIKAYATKKMEEFLAIYAKLQQAAELMKDLDEDIVIVPHTTNWDDFMKKIDARADEFVYKAGKAKNNPEEHRLKPGESITF